jgi:hypothetical protein
MKNFQQYIKEEIQLKGNKGVPDEFINKSDQETPQKLGIRKDDPRQMMHLGPQIMQLIGKSNSLLTNGLTKNQIENRFERLEKLAEEVIRSEYESILDNVDLDIKLIRPGKKVSDEMPEMCEQEAAPKLQKLNDPEIRKAVDAAKLRNNIIQGEAKNTKNILHSEKVKKGLKDIFGAQWEEVFKTWDEITKVADKMDWVIPIEHKADMMEKAPEGMAGACKVEWPEKKEDEDSELSDKILKDLEKGKDLNEIEDVDKLLDSGNPKIKAVGIDFPMLLHETVKGIYELISSVAIPEDPKKAEIVALNTQSFEDEAEDFRYGPIIAGKLRDSINKCEKIDEVPNVREKVYGKMCQLKDDDFLKLMMEILKESTLAISGLQNLVDQVLFEERDYQQKVRDWEMDQKFGDNTSDDSEDKEQEDDYNDIVLPDLGIPVSDEDSEVDYSKLRQIDLMKILDDALDKGDFELVKKVSPFIKESVLLPYKNEILLLERKYNKKSN